MVFSLVLQDGFEFFNVRYFFRPLAGSETDEAAANLGGALDEEQGTGGRDDQLELPDRNIRRAHGADFAPTEGACGEFPAGEHEGDDAGKEEDDVQEQFKPRLRLGRPGAEEDVAAYVAVAGKSVSAAHHEQRAVHHVRDVKSPGGRVAQHVAHENLVTHPENHHHDAPRKRVANPGRKFVDRFDVALHVSIRSVAVSARRSRLHIVDLQARRRD